MALSWLAMCGLLPHNNLFFFYRGVGNSKLPGMSQGPSLPTNRCHRPKRMGTEAWSGFGRQKSSWQRGEKMRCWAEEVKTRKMKRGRWGDGRKSWARRICIWAFGRNVELLNPGGGQSCVRSALARTTALHITLCSSPSTLVQNGVQQ